MLRTLAGPDDHVLRPGERPSLRRATTTPARHPGARPPFGGRIDSASRPQRVISHEITEFEFHISPAPSSARPQTGVGAEGTSSRTRRASSESCEPSRALDSLGDIGNDAAGPAADLVPKDPEAPGQLSADRPLATTPRSSPSPRGTGADSITNRSSGAPDHERRVVEVARRATLRVEQRGTRRPVRSGVRNGHRRRAAASTSPRLSHVRSPAHREDGATPADPHPQARRISLRRTTRRRGQFMRSG